MIEIEKKKKMKDGYLKLILLKIWVLNCKSDEKSGGVVSQIFPIKYEYLIVKVMEDKKL
jgi:hypothetical protein